MQNSILYSIEKTAFRDYYFAILLFIIFICIFYAYSLWREKRAFLKSKKKPKLYIMTIFLSLIAAALIGVVTESAILNIDGYYIEYYYLNISLGIIFFVTLFIAMRMVSKYKLKFGTHKKALISGFMVAIGAITYGVYQLREGAYPFANKEVFNSFVDNVVNKSPIPEIGIAILKKNPDIYKELQTKIVAIIYENRGKKAPKYGMKFEDSEMLTELIFDMLNEHELNYERHARDEDLIAVFKPLQAFLNHIAKQGDCNMDFSQYAVSNKNDKEAEQIKSQLIDALVVAIENSDINRIVTVPDENRMFDLYSKVISPSYMEQASNETDPNKYCMYGIMFSNELLQLSDSELAEAVRYFISSRE